MLLCIVLYCYIIMPNLEQAYVQFINIISGFNPSIVNDELYLRMLQTLFKIGVVFILMYVIHWTLAPCDFIDLLATVVLAICIYFLIIIPANEILLEIQLKDRDLSI